MTFIDFKKHLLDAEISLPKFCSLVKVSEKNIQAYKKKGDIPNCIAALVQCIVKMHQEGIDYKEEINSLNLVAKTKKGAGFGKDKIKGITKSKKEKSE